jgi:beta-glucanase (GH16 family)
MSQQTYVNADGVVLSLTTTPTSTLETLWSSPTTVQTLDGDSGDDNFVFFFPTDSVVVPATHGIYTITDSAWNTTYALPTGFNNLIVNGNAQIASGNSQANLIETGSGIVTVSGGGGDDVFVLGTGADTIIDPQGSGNDVIYNFNAAIDVVRLDGSTVFTGWSSIEAALQQVGANVILNMGSGQTLTFDGATLADFTSADFDLPIDYAAMTMTFDGTFNTFTSSPSGDIGTWATTFPYVGPADRGQGADGAAYFSDSSAGYNPFSVSNGILSITATTAAAAGGNPDNLPYESGVITTYKSFSQLYGYFEIKCELPAGQGLWPAFYMQSDSGAAELDILELLGSNPSLLYPTASDHATNTATNLAVQIPDSSTNFNTYGVDWEPNTITFYVNGNVVGTAPTPASMDVPMYMIAELDVGTPGSWAGAPTTDSIFPAAMQIAYVRAYATAATEDVGGSDAIPLPIAVTPATEAVTSTHGASVNPFTGIGISDENAAQTETATVTLSSAGTGTLSDPTAATDGSTVVNGAWTIAGSAATVAAALDGLVFAPQAGQTTPSVTTTVTATIADTAGETAVATSTVTAIASPGSITAATLHYGATTDNSWGTGIGGVTVSLVNAAGTVVATAVSNSSGKFSFGQVGVGTYQLQYTAPTGDGFLPTGPDAAVTGLTAQFTVASGQAVNAPNGDLISTIAMNGTGLTEVAPAGAYLVSGNAGNSTLTLGNGNQFVMLTGGGDTVTTGTGNQTISLAGNNNTITVGNGNNTITLAGTGNTVTDTGGSGTSTFNAGSGNDTVHVTGGTDNITINATGSGNLFDAGPGLNFLNADGSAGNTFMLNPGSNPSTSLTTITGFNPAGDILDLKRTLAGTSILPSLSNLGSLVTSAFSGANTTLYVNPTGHGTATAFAVLDGVHLTVAQLLAAKDFSLS